MSGYRPRSAVAPLAAVACAVLLGLWPATITAAAEGEMTWAVLVQQIIHERVMFGPVIEPAFLNGVGPRVEQSGLGTIANHAYSAPYEDVALRKR